MLIIKSSVRLKGISPELSIGLTVAAGVYQNYNQDCVVTSVTDGQHMVGSLHYTGHAADLRLSGNSPPEIARALRAALGPEWDVILEPDHLHIEYDPA